MTSELQRDIELVELVATHLNSHEFRAAWQRLKPRLTPDRERVARAMFAFAANWDAMPNDDEDYWLALADAAIAAMGEGP